MNIFYLHPDASLCAQQHCDKHVVKMILESVQMLEAAHWRGDGKQPAYYNHPCSKWVRENALHYAWLSLLAQELVREYGVRYGKLHAYYGRIENLRVCIPLTLPHEPFNEPPLCMPDECKFAGNAVASYRAYYAVHKQRFAKWTNREIPGWFTRMVAALQPPGSSRQGVHGDLSPGLGGTTTPDAQ